MASNKEVCSVVVDVVVVLADLINAA